LLSPIYSTPGTGGTGFSLSFNIVVWAIAIWFIAIGLLVLSKKLQIFAPRQLCYLLLFPSIIIINGLLAEINQPITWLFRIIYVFGGLFFLISLFQFSITASTIDRLLFVLVIAMGLHASVGSLQIIAPHLLPNWIPRQMNFVPRSLFQQINMQASFLATGIVSSLYLISRPSFQFSSLFLKITLLVSFSLAIYIITASGSRIGLLSLLLGVPLILWSRYKLLLKHKKFLSILLITSCIGVAAGYAGLNQTLDKVARLNAGEYSDARWSIYTISAELIAQKPLVGHGIGNFLKAWNPQAADFYLRHPNTSLPQFILHPHNEIFFWMIELGLPALIGISAVTFGIAKALYYCGFQRGVAYTAILLPISLHTQLEHPFYISSIHWFLWLFLLFIIFRHQTKQYVVCLSTSAIRLIQIIAFIVSIGGTWFLVNTAQAQIELKNFMSSKIGEDASLSIALTNLYFNPVAEQSAMRKLLLLGVKTRNKKHVETYEEWANLAIKSNPDLNIYKALFYASSFLRPKGKGCDVLKEGIAMYPQNKFFQNAYLNCLQL